MRYPLIFGNSHIVGLVTGLGFEGVAESIEGLLRVLRRRGQRQCR